MNFQTIRIKFKDGTVKELDTFHVSTFDNKRIELDSMIGNDRPHAVIRIYPGGIKSQYSYKLMVSDAFDLKDITPNYTMYEMIGLIENKAICNCYSLLSNCSKCN